MIIDRCLKGLDTSISVLALRLTYSCEGILITCKLSTPFRKFGQIPVAPSWAPAPAEPRGGGPISRFQCYTHRRIGTMEAPGAGARQPL